MHTVSRYHPAIVAMHWVLALLIIADLAIGTGVLAHLANDSPRKLEGLRAHMAAGMLILFLMTLRLGVRERARPASRRADRFGRPGSRGVALAPGSLCRGDRLAAQRPCAGAAGSSSAGRLPRPGTPPDEPLGLSAQIRAPGLRPRADGVDRPAPRRRRLSRLPAPRRPSPPHVVWPARDRPPRCAPAAWRRLGSGERCCWPRPCCSPRSE